MHVGPKVEPPGFKCDDNFAKYMGRDYDCNADGQIDSDALRYVQGETEAAYVTRITSTLRSTIRRNTKWSTRRPRTTTSSRTTRTDVHGRHGVRRALRRNGLRLLGAGLRRQAVRERQEPDLEPVRPRALGLGAVGVQPGDAVSYCSRRMRMKAGTPA